MVGGLLQLVSKGIDDAFLTHDPQITLFKCVYRRHSNFCKIERRLNFSNKLTFEKTGHCSLKKLADLVHRLYFVIDLPEIIIKYEFLTVKKINYILGLVGMKYPFSEKFTDSTRITKNFYIKNIIPYIILQISAYISLINLAKNEIEIIKTTIKEYDPSKFNISKYLFNTDTNLFKTTIRNINSCEIQPNYPLLPIKYEIYNKLIYIKTKLDSSIIPLYNVYNFLINQYLTIDGERIQLYNANTVKNVICDVAQSILFEKKSGTITLTPGYSGYDGYIIKDNNGNIVLTQPNYVGDNYAFLNAININDDDVVFIQTYSNYNLSVYFDNFIQNCGVDNTILQNLDMYLLYKISK